MKINNAYSFLLTLVVLAGLTSCQKKDQPQLQAGYPVDYLTTPATSLRFYANFDSTAELDKQINIRFKDSISGYPSFFPDNSISVVPGVHGSAYKGNLDKNLSYINSNDFIKATSFSVAFWEKKDGINNSDAEFVMSIPVDTVGGGQHWSNSTMLLIFDHKGGGSSADSSVVKLMVAEMGNGDHWFELTGANRMYKVTDNQWHHLAFSYDETTSDMKIYRDGVLYSTQSWGGHGAIHLNVPKVKAFYLGGKTTDWGKSFNGSLDQFRLYNKAISASDVANLYNNKL